MAQDSFAPEQIKAMVPAGRAGSPDEVAALVAFLCSNQAAYITGSILPVAGGDLG